MYGVTHMNCRGCLSSYSSCITVMLLTEKWKNVCVCVCLPSSASTWPSMRHALDPLLPQPLPPGDWSVLEFIHDGIFKKGERKWSQACGLYSSIRQMDKDFLLAAPRGRQPSSPHALTAETPSGRRHGHRHQSERHIASFLSVSPHQAQWPWGQRCQPFTGHQWHHGSNSEFTCCNAVLLFTDDLLNYLC